MLGWLDPLSWEDTSQSWWRASMIPKRGASMYRCTHGQPGLITLPDRLCLRTFPISTTIAEKHRFGRPEAPDDGGWYEAARLANLHSSSTRCQKDKTKGFEGGANSRGSGNWSALPAHPGQTRHLNPGRSNSNVDTLTEALIRKLHPTCSRSTAIVIAIVEHRPAADWITSSTGGKSLTRDASDAAQTGWGVPRLTRQHSPSVPEAG